MEDIERIAKLEAQHQELMRLLQETRDDMKEMHEDIHVLKESLTKWKGVSAGIAITISCAWALMLGIYNLLSGKT